MLFEDGRLENSYITFILCFYFSFSFVQSFGRVKHSTRLLLIVFFFFLLQIYDTIIASILALMENVAYSCYFDITKGGKSCWEGM